MEWKVATNPIQPGTWSDNDKAFAFAADRSLQRRHIPHPIPDTHLPGIHNGSLILARKKLYFLRAITSGAASSLESCRHPSLPSATR